MAPPRKKRKTEKKVENEALKTTEAMLTIERLSRKYLHKSPNVSANDRGVVELSLPSPILDNQSNKDNRRKTFSLSHTQQRRPKRLAKSTSDKTRSKVLTPSNSVNRRSSVKVSCQKPAHSTPKEVSASTENSTLGYEDMPTPSGFSPDVSPMEVLDTTRSSGESVSKMTLSVKRETRPYITPAKKRHKKRAKFEETEVRKWVNEMNREFEEVDNFQLLVE